MVIAFQVILLVVIAISFMGVLGEKEDESLQKRMETAFLAGLAAFIVSVLWL